MRRPHGSDIPDENIRDLDPTDLPVVPERFIGLHERLSLDIIRPDFGQKVGNRGEEEILLISVPECPPQVIDRRALEKF